MPTLVQIAFQRDLQPLRLSARPLTLPSATRSPLVAGSGATKGRASRSAVAIWTGVDTNTPVCAALGWLALYGID